ncbi:metal-dependent hydrolase [Sinimarinibacterium sp. CAU 1509]|uniref:metal-dependent hydrolase n=1 Tax=Sinimarinibacterium sp. CAU 1509 TaxID=2562283 RepID=UPI0010ABA5DF|nr:metal-dependent hydrolase [Sinimarinibacterium sp. CAU 1509]TJY58389.1 metal-dependent hydrolase [Sinimarinibacterium sp. CAU 1509]
MPPVLSSTAQTLSQTPYDINVRADLKWDFSKVGKQFVDGDPLISCLWAAFSIGAPVIERFFIKALKPTVDTIVGDEKLIDDVRCMIAQEVHHSAAHIVFNKHLESLGFDVKAVTKQMEATVQVMTRDMTPIDMLGIVAAGEHALYSFAQVFIRSNQVRKTMHPQVERLFLYHMLEEAEHGAVSHDQYRYFAGNDYFHRLRTASRARHLFSLLTDAVSTLSGQLDVEITAKNWIALHRYLWGNPGLFRLMIGNLAGYLAPWYQLTFTHEDEADIKRWNDELYAGQP